MKIAIIKDAYFTSKTDERLKKLTDIAGCEYVLYEFGQNIKTIRETCVCTLGGKAWFASTDIPQFTRRRGYIHKFDNHIVMPLMSISSLSDHPEFIDVFISDLRKLCKPIFPETNKFRDDCTGKDTDILIALSTLHPTLPHTTDFAISIFANVSYQDYPEIVKKQVHNTLLNLIDKASLYDIYSKDLKFENNILDMLKKSPINITPSELTEIYLQTGELSKNITDNYGIDTMCNTSEFRTNLIASGIIKKGNEFNPESIVTELSNSDHPVSLDALNLVGLRGSIKSIRNQNKIYIQPNLYDTNYGGAVCHPYIYSLKDIVEDEQLNKAIYILYPDINDISAYPTECGIRKVSNVYGRKLIVDRKMKQPDLINWNRLSTTWDRHKRKILDSI